MKADVILDGATVIAVEKTIKGELVEGWALPGGRFTAHRLHAQAAAEHMSRIMKANRGAKGAQPI